MTGAPFVRLFLGVLVLGAGVRAAAVPQPPHDEATHAVRCENCHLAYADPRVARHDPASATGAAAAASAATRLVDDGKAWGDGDWVGGAITFTSGANADQFRTIVASDATSVSWAFPLPQPLAAGDTYQLGKVTQYDVQDRCWTCHVAGGQAPPPSGAGSPALHGPRGGAVVVGCGKCHEPHNVEASSGAGNDLVRAQVRRLGGSTTTVTYPAGGNRFITGGPGYTGVCEACHTQTKYHRNNASGDHAHNAGTPCTQCHKHDKGFTLGACDSCHGAPPPTGAHVRHFGGTLDQVQYGDVRLTAELAAAPTTSYVFGCGNCHPLDPGRHMDGTVDVELYDATAPATSLKGAAASAGATYVPGPTAIPDPQNAAITYTLGTCSGVYCHSGNGWTTPGGVPEPTNAPGHPTGPTDPRFTLPSPVVYPIVYPPFTLITTRAYATVGWGDAAPGCGGCHGYPPRSSYPTNAAGAGDSHAWIDNYGYENLHNYDMGFAPVQCRTCHYDTVTGTATWTRDGMDVTTWGAQPVADARHHVDGTNSVRFDTVDPLEYATRPATPIDLAPANWDSSTRTCTNVGCHEADTTVRWGTPYRWWNTFECNACHRY